jgi:hypothetical protein
LYAKIDGGANTILKTITLTPQWQRFYFNVFDTPIPERHQIQYVVEMDSTVGDSPLIYEINTLYEIVKY